jgi:cytochrome o ubiquinol oxidase subunit 3
MHTAETAIDHHEHPHTNTDAIDVFGFWLYIMTDCVLFGSLFATFIVLNTGAMQPSALKSHLDLYDILIETMLLLVSNFTFCLAALNVYQKKLLKVQLWLAATFIFGASFVVMEVNEFFHLAKEGFRWDINGQASAFFTLVGTHGLHVSFGLLWILFLIVQMPLLKMNEVAKRRMTYLGLFWNFLDIVWIFVFTIVYLMGAL